MVSDASERVRRLAGALMRSAGDGPGAELISALQAIRGIGFLTAVTTGRKGASPETSWHMSKAGNSHLRAAAYRIAVVGIQHNPVIVAHYRRKRDAGKSKGCDGTGTPFPIAQLGLT